MEAGSSISNSVRMLGEPSGLATYQITESLSKSNILDLLKIITELFRKIRLSSLSIY